MRKGGVLTPVTWQEALAAAADKLGALAPSEIGVFAGPLADVEALVCAKDLFNKLGSTTTAMAAATAAPACADVRPSYVMNSVTKI